jgi:P4 family phage/plasmid primase-like protien
MWRAIAERQAIHADGLWKIYIAKSEALLKGVPYQGKMVDPEEPKIAKALFDKWAKHALNSGKNKNAKDAIEAAKSIRGIALHINKLDSNRRLLGVANGVLDLTADGAKLRKAKQEDYLMFNTGIEYIEPSGIGLKLWNDYLDTFLPDADLRETAQVALGHCVIGGNPEKRVIVLKGVPNTGKSTMVAMIERALGDYAGSTSMNLFKSGGFNTDFLTCANKRAVILSEFEERDELSASVIKRLSGNSDKMTTPVKNSNVIFSAVPQFVSILPTNAVPTISGADKALQDRLFVIPFNVRPTSIDRGATNVLIEMAAQAALWWLIEGYNKYCVFGELPVSDVVRQETADFVSNLDEIATFRAECIKEHSRIDDPTVDWKKNSDWCVTRTKMYEEFKRWWEANNLNPNKLPSMPRLKERLSELGIPGTPGTLSARVSGVSNRWWFGVKVLQGGGTVSRLPGNAVGFKVLQTDSVTDSVTEEK